MSEPKGSSWIVDAIEAVGVTLVEELLRVGVDHVLHPDTVVGDVAGLLDGATRVADIIPTRLATDDESDKIAADIARATSGVVETPKTVPSPEPEPEPSKG